MDVGVVVLVVVDDRIDHRPRLLRGGPVVQVDQRLAVHLLGEGGEIELQSGGIKRHAGS